MHPHPLALVEGFRSAIEDCRLVELDLTGANYTREKSKGKPNSVRKCLDRVFATEKWWQKYPLCTLEVNHTICSDHEPIQLKLADLSVSRKQFMFRF